MSDRQPTDDGARLDALRAMEILDTPAEPAFDDVVALAAQVCGTPTALVSLVDTDRQWFKARVGFPACETDLDRSVCSLVVDAAEPVVIPDLTADSRTAANPLVTGEPAIRFYAGAPLITATGHALGALCVIDRVARPAGLTAAQQSALTALARLTTRTMEERRAAAEYRRSVEASAAADVQWRELFQQLQEGLIVATALRDPTGAVVDWRYDQVNAAWSTIVGIDGDAVVGRPISEVLPGIKADWIALAKVVDTGEKRRFVRQVGMLDRWYDGTVQPIGGDRFTITFVEATDRIAAADRQRALLEVGDVLRDHAIIGEMTRRTAEIVGRTLHASRAGYGTVDVALEGIDLEPDWTADRVPSIAGYHRFDDFGALTDELRRGEPLVVADVATDPRTRDRRSSYGAMSIRAMVNVTVRDQGRPVGVFVVHDAAPRHWSDEELAFIRNVADRLEVAVARLRAEEGQALLNGEIAHRLKNSLAMVQAIANRTLRGSTDPDRLESFQSRLRALGTAHDILLGHSLRSADLGEVVARALDGAGAGGRYVAAGPAVAIGARATLSTSLLLHELATNAMKYGALSTGGTVEIAWHLEGENGDLVLDWSERGGPPATPPTRKGFGSRLLSLGLVGTGGADLRYDAEGFHARFAATTEHLGQS